MLPVTMGEVTFVFSFLGTSSLSNILEVLISSSLLLTGEDKTNISVLGLEKQGEENISGAPFTTSCSHSSATEDVLLSSLAVRLNSGESSSTTTVSVKQLDCKITSEESRWFEFSSDVVSFCLGRIDLEHCPCKEGKYQENFHCMSIIDDADHEYRCPTKLQSHKYYRTTL